MIEKARLKICAKEQEDMNHFPTLHAKDREQREKKEREKERKKKITKERGNKMQAHILLNSNERKTLRPTRSNVIMTLFRLARSASSISSFFFLRSSFSC